MIKAPESSKLRRPIGKEKEGQERREACNEISGSGRDKWIARFILAASRAQFDIPTTATSSSSFGNAGSINPWSTLSGFNLYLYKKTKQNKKKKKRKVLIRWTYILWYLSETYFVQENNWNDILFILISSHLTKQEKLGLPYYSPCISSLSQTLWWSHPK